MFGTSGCALRATVDSSGCPIVYHYRFSNGNLMAAGSGDLVKAS